MVKVAIGLRCTRDSAPICLAEGNVIDFKRPPQRAFEGDSCFGIGPLGGHFRGTRLSQETLELNDQLVRRDTHIELLLLHLDGLFLQDASLHRRFVSGSCLLHGHLRIRNL